MRHLLVDYLSARSLSDCHSSLYTKICLNTAPQTKYLNTAPDTVTPWRTCIQSTAIRRSKRFRNFFISFFYFHVSVFSVPYFIVFVAFPFRRIFYVFVFVNRNHTCSV